jgi:phosphatidylserine decarboxylase
MTAVGATNVGSIKIDFDELLATNQGSYSPSCNCNELRFQEKLSIGKGDHFGQFNFGSTIILVFEAPKNFKFSVTPGQSVKVGMSL